MNYLFQSKEGDMRSGCLAVMIIVPVLYFLVKLAPLIKMIPKVV